MSRKMNRKEERELALRGIFQIDFHAEDAELDNSLKNFFEMAGQGDTEDEVAGMTGGYARKVINATIENQTAIDGLIASHLKETWDFSRVPKMEKAIMRLGVTELLYTKVPKEVAINEAVELAKKYASEESKTYINGILNKVAVEHADELSKD